VGVIYFDKDVAKEFHLAQPFDVVLSHGKDNRQVAKHGFEGFEPRSGESTWIFHVEGTMSCHLMRICSLIFHSAVWIINLEK